MRANLFYPESEDDWNNCVHEDKQIVLINNFEYARKLNERYEGAWIVGIEFPVDPCYKAKPGLLGFDVLDSHWDVSPLTNWGTDEERIFSGLLMENGLLGDVTQALRIRDTLRARFLEDDHARECHVCARAGVFIVDAKSHDEVTTLVRSVPAWGVWEWDIKPLESFAHRAALETTMIQGLRAKK